MESLEQRIQGVLREDVPLAQHGGRRGSGDETATGTLGAGPFTGSPPAGIQVGTDVNN
jgi:hypothetical protein